MDLSGRILARLRRPERPDGSPDHQRLIALLKAERDGAGLTQQAVADRLGVPQSYVAKDEGGERRLDVLELITVARALGADPAELFAALL